MQQDIRLGEMEEIMGILRVFHGSDHIIKTPIYPGGKEEFPIVKDTTPNMMNPRLYTTSYNKPQGQQFDDTAVLSFIKLQYT